MSDAQLYGWYSPSSAVDQGIFIYSKPDGRQVAVTEVVSGTKLPMAACFLNDLVSIGPVSKYIRRIRPNNKDIIVKWDLGIKHVEFQIFRLPMKLK